MASPLAMVAYWALIVVAAAAAEIDQQYVSFLPVPSPVQCSRSSSASSSPSSFNGRSAEDCTIDNYQGMWGDRQPCRASRAFFPTTEAELVAAVAWAARTSSKVKVVSKGSHSLPKLACPGGHDGTLISTHLYNSLIHINASALTVTAHAGVMLRPLIRALAAHGLTLTQVPYWVGVSVAGMISTGAHGSGMLHLGSTPHDYVVGMRLVVPADERHGYARVVELAEGDADLDAAKLSLGVLGAISTVTFRVEPMFKRAVTTEMRGDERLEDEVVEFAKKHEFGKLKWFPGSGKALYKLDDRVGVEEDGDGEYKMSFTDKMDVKIIADVKSVVETLGRTRQVDGLCEQEAKLVNRQLTSGDGMVNYGSTFTSYPVVGFNHKVQAGGGCEEETYPNVTPTHIEFSGEIDEHVEHEDATMGKDSARKVATCFWNPRIDAFSFFDSAIAIPTSRFRDAIIEIKKLRDLNPKAMCSLSYVGGGIHMRFLAASKAYLGLASDSVVFEMIYYRSKTPFTPWMYQDLFEEIEQMLIQKFDGRPHWGKNRELAFEGVHARIPSLEKFLQVRQRFDPFGIFSSEWSDAILGLNPSSQRVQTFQDHCALEGLCICQEDSHCHPTKGYFCRQGYVYKEARVCRYESLDSVI